MKRKEKKPEGLCGIVFSSHAIHIVKKKKNCDYFSTSNQKTKSVSYIRINGQIDVQTDKHVEVSSEVLCGAIDSVVQKRRTFFPPRKRVKGRKWKSFLFSFDFHPQSLLMQTPIEKRMARVTTTIYCVPVHTPVIPVLVVLLESHNVGEFCPLASAMTRGKKLLPRKLISVWDVCPSRFLLLKR